MNNPVKGNTPRQGNSWWILLVVLLIVVGIVWALGRSNREAVDHTPAGLPTSSNTVVPDQIENTVRTDGHPERKERVLIGDEPAQVRSAEAE